MTQAFCVVNQKGGVGKTTTAISLSAGLARAGEPTLIIDLDPQCNATNGLNFEPTRHHVLATGEDMSQAIRKTAIEQLDILPGCRSFTDIETMVHSDEERTRRMIEQLKSAYMGYHYVLFDCPPSIGHLTKTALDCSSKILMPIQCEYFAMVGLSQMVELMAEIMLKRQGELSLAGVVLTMYDPTLEVTHEVDREVRDYFGDFVFKTVIPRDVALSEAPSFGQSIFEYAPRSRGARAYTELCMEVLERV